MLGWAIAFFILAIIAAVFGFTALGGAMAAIAQILVFLFLVLFFVALVAGAARGRTPKAM